MGTKRILDPKEYYKKYYFIEPETGCWIWTGHYSDSGYGRVTYNGRPQPAHRIIYELYKGKIEEGKEPDHLCIRRACVNPDHIEPVNHSENISRATSKIDIAEVEQIKQHHRNGVSARELSKIYGVHENSIHRYISGKRRQI